MLSNGLLTLSAPSQRSSLIASNTLENIEGSWLRTMHTPEVPTLRIGVEVFKKADSQWGGNFRVWIKVLLMFILTKT